jgi:D-alanyl-D-alanine carboxypeptidase
VVPNRLLPVVLLCSIIASSAQTEKLDDYLRAEMAKGRIPGLSAAVLRDGKLLTARSYGLANVEFSIAVSGDTLHQLASATKLFTGTAIMMLVEEGKLSLEDQVIKPLPELPAAWSNVTVQHLLSHTSGIPDWFEASVGPQGNRLDLRATRDEIIKKISGKPVEFQPGEKWSYNQAGPVLLGMIKKIISGGTFENFLDQRVFKPLAMTTTRFGNSRDVIKNLNPTWYMWENNVLRRFDLDYPSWSYPGAGLNTTISDLAKWDAALYTEKLIKRSTLERMWARTRLNNGQAADYGLGWAVFDLEGRKAVGHGGGRNNWVVHFVDSKLTIIVLSNLFRADALSLVRGVAALYLPPSKASLEVVTDTMARTARRADWERDSGRMKSTQ